MDTSATAAIRVFVIAQPMFRWGLERLIDTEPDRYRLAGNAGSIEEAQAALEPGRVDVLLLDVDAHGGPAGLHRLLSLLRKVRVLALSACDPGSLDWALMSGLRGVVRKGDEPATVLKALRKVHEGEIWADRGATTRILAEIWRRAVVPVSEQDRQRIATLTQRERQTIRALASDAAAPCKVIADRLSISEHTLRNHLTSIYAKLELHNRVDLYAFATKSGLQDGAESRLN